MSGTDLDNGANAFDDKGRESFSISDNGSAKDLINDSGLSLQDKGWISPPDSIYSSSSESGITSAEASFPDSLHDPEELIRQSPCGSGTRVATYHLNSAPSSQTGCQKISDPGQSGFNSNNDSVTGIGELTEHLKSVAPPSDEAVNVPVEPSQPLDDESSKEKFEGKNDEVSSLNKVKIEDENQESPHPNLQTGSRVAKGNV